MQPYRRSNHVFGATVQNATVVPLDRGIKFRRNSERWGGGTQPAVGLPAQASIIFPVGYDNTANTVTSGPTANNLQTTGNYRDIWWASLNNNLPRVGSPDYINYGKNLVQVANHAEDNGTGLYDALNFTGPTINGRQNYLTIFDTTPANGATTQDKFTLGPNAQSPLTIIADFMFAGPGHNVSAGIVALYGEGNDGLALLANNVSGNNPNTDDHSFVSLIYKNFVGSTEGNNTTLATVNITDNLDSNSFLKGEWYRATMNLWQDVTGLLWNISGAFQHHTDDNPANNVLGAAFGSISASGSLLNPDPDVTLANDFLSNPGQIGLIVQGREAISAGAVAPGIPLPGGQSTNSDNVGVSFYLQPGQGDVPEPMSLIVWAILITVGFSGRPRRSHRCN